MENIMIKQYDKESPQIFSAAKENLKKNLKSCEIHHTGSTAVPGLGGKNFIDILVICPKKSDI